MPLSFSRRALAPVALLGGLLAGCGGSSDFGNFNRSLGGDIGSGYNTSLSSRQQNGSGRGGTGAATGTYPRIETAFSLASVPGDPFDYEKVNVQVSLKRPDNSTVDVPCFFDGGTTWRMRFTPNAPGTYAVVSVKLNREIAHEDKLEKKEWNVTGDPQPGFVRIDRGDKSRFIFDNGSRYFPLGHNVAWTSAKVPDYSGVFGKMGAAGENWSRIWMTHWDGKNLDWPQNSKEASKPDPKTEAKTEAKAEGKTETKVGEGASSPATSAGPTKLGDIDLEVAKKWDAVVDAAGKNGIYFQMVLQHHGQYASRGGYKYSSNVNPNWEENPYNVKNGGFLDAPEEFFSNPQARTLTRRKLYYILSRWGWSPNILSFELFNEVEGTDAAHGKQWDDIALWHREMSLFLRQFDGYHHLLTTSSAPAVPLNSPIWETVDYVQYHAYPSDVATTLGAALPDAARKLGKPIFYGEFGPQSLKDDSGTALHRGLWASLTSDTSAPAQYWDWENVEANNLYSQFGAAAKFVTSSGLAERGGLTVMPLAVETTQRADLRFAPGGGWGAAPASTEFVVGETGPPAGIASYPAFLQGETHRDMMPKPLSLSVRMPQAGTFTVTVGQVSKAGANLKVSVDGKAETKAYDAGSKDYEPEAKAAKLSVPVGEGVHTITIENTGKDWVNIRELALSNYASALGAQARMSKDYAIAWVYRRSVSGETGTPSPVSGKMTLAGLQKGKYRLAWWDTQGGKALDSAEVEVTDPKVGLTLTTPPVTQDTAFYLTRSGTGPNGAAKGKKGRPGTTAKAVPSAPTAPTSGEPTAATPTQAPAGNPTPGATNGPAASAPTSSAKSP